ncbi:MAG: hypothetical protein AAGH67_04050 [Cyanobacteria bacterium P01_H01_bin.162]
MALDEKNSNLENVDTFERDQSWLFVVFVVLCLLFIGLITAFEGFRRFNGEGFILIVFGLALCGLALRYRWYAQKPAVEVSHRKILVRRLLFPSYQIHPRDVTKIEVQLHKIRPQRSSSGYHLIEYITCIHRNGQVTKFIAPRFFSNEDLLDSLQLKTGIQVERLPIVERKP